MNYKEQNYSYNKMKINPQNSNFIKTNKNCNSMKMQAIFSKNNIIFINKTFKMKN